MHQNRAAEASKHNAEISPILASLQEIHAKYQQDFSGKVATYIPELAKADTSLFGIALVTADGQVYQTGDANHWFTIQSISKPFVYGVALEDQGLDYVLSKVGVEPTGEAFNSIVFDERRNRPFNPMVNAGAIATTALIKGTGHDQRLARLLGKFSDLAGRPLSIDHAVYTSERTTGHRNRAIAYLELNFGMIDEPVNEHLDLYFEQCSILVSARDLAVMAATLANNGVNPLTGKRALDEPYVKNVLSVMYSCGMYDYAGEWSYRIGLPAKSGVGGGIIAVLPGQFGIGTFSAPLDEQGNSWRGIRACEDLSKRFKLHMFKSRLATGVVVRRSYRNTTVRSKRRRGAAAETILGEKGSSVCVYELQGSLFFSTMEQVLRQVTNDMDSFTYLILDFKRVLQLDECARALLAQTNEMLNRCGKTLLSAHLAEDRADSCEPGGQSGFFADIDSALEWCEDQLLQQEHPELLRERRKVPFAAMDILAGFDHRETALIESIAEEMRYSPGATIVREGDRADSLYLLAAGRVSICLRINDGARRQRLSTLSPGLAFGDVALLDGGTRSADVIADEPTRCYVLPFAKLQTLAVSHPEVFSRLIGNIGRELSARLRRADAEIRSLAD
ncbi:MAG: glutaminase A [Deltaproteobacteria bacterium]|nr:glutaminase A [Deltaproteobacteria bacterium]MDZ4345658.1 glutaminase A [Candidatus Binatia bacterium]